MSLTCYILEGKMRLTHVPEEYDEISEPPCSRLQGRKCKLEKNLHNKGSLKHRNNSYSIITSGNNMWGDCVISCVLAKYLVTGFNLQKRLQ